MSTAPTVSKLVEKAEARVEVKKSDVAEVTADVKTSVSAEPAASHSSPKVHGAFDITALRRAWPDVIEDVKKRRRLTWSLLSASAQVLAVDDTAITIGIVNAGARDSFVRSESDEILRKAFVDVVGIDRRIECVVDPSIDTNTPLARETRTSEAPTDKVLLSGAALLAQELGARYWTKVCATDRISYFAGRTRNRCSPS
jgi:DNA polymerase-3 subunit gamma/tau